MNSRARMSTTRRASSTRAAERHRIQKGRALCESEQHARARLARLVRLAFCALDRKN